jgi:hypothetical protein
VIPREEYLVTRQPFRTSVGLLVTTPDGLGVAAGDDV